MNINNLLPHLAVLPDPLLKGLHYYHDHRWIVTAGSHWEDDTRGYQGGDIGYTLEDGSAIAQMRDCQFQAQYARLFAAAPDLLEACKGMLQWARRTKLSEPNPGVEVLNAINAIDKAEGRDSNTGEAL